MGALSQRYPEISFLHRYDDFILFNEDQLYIEDEINTVYDKHSPRT